MTDDDRPAFAQAMNLLVTGLRESDPDVVQMRTYFQVLKTIEIEFVVAAAQHLVVGDHFPRVGEWKREAERMKTERLEAQREAMRRSPVAWCAECDDTGWRPVALVERGRPVRRVTRCACQDQRYAELLGRATFPALPAYREATHQVDIEAIAAALAKSATVPPVKKPKRRK